MSALRHKRPFLSRLPFKESQFLTDTVENVENRTAPKIS